MLREKLRFLNSVIEANFLENVCLKSFLNSEHLIQATVEDSAVRS